MTDCREAETLQVSIILFSPGIVDVCVPGFDGISLQSFSADAFVAVVDHAVNAGVLSGFDKSDKRNRRQDDEHDERERISLEENVCAGMAKVNNSNERTTGLTMMIRRRAQ